MQDKTISEKQEAEIKSIKARNFQLKLSDADVERIFLKAGEAGLSVSELLENFIGDLVGGTYSNGSDERDHASQWFDRCWFGMGLGEFTFLQWLISVWCVEDALGDWIRFLNYRENIIILDEDDKADMENVKQSLDAYFEEYKQQPQAAKDGTIESEMPKVEQWWNEMNRIAHPIVCPRK